MFSGIQPTGELHLGNYFGAIKSWIALLNDYAGIFCIVDYHAITIPYDPKQLQTKIFDAAASYLACGLDPEHCIIFVQSEVPEHTELSWFFSTIAPLGLLERMTQFKDKSSQHHQSIHLGLLAYPVLQAADILMYNAAVVPVGEDQAQHLELTREIARKCNNAFGKQFVEPETKLSTTPRLLGIYGEEKMSKSKDNHITLFMPENQLKKRIGKCITDKKRITISDPGEPNDCNLYMSYHALFTSPEERANIAEGCRTATLGCGECKAKLCANMNTFMEPMRAKKASLDANPNYVREVLAHGAKTARAMAQETMHTLRSHMGLR